MTSSVFRRAASEQRPTDNIPMELDAAPATVFRDVVVIGGGCYGSFYASQLIGARSRGKVTFRSVLVVDRDPNCQVVRENRLAAGVEMVVGAWNDFLDEFLRRDPPAAGAPDDAIVPSPLMPHLMADWIVRESGRRGAPLVQGSLETAVGTPYDVLAPDGTRYVSFADWLCPTHCVEPAICPVIKAPRTWEMSEALAEYVAARNRTIATAGPVLFVTTHRAFGVGMFDVGPARRALELLARGRTDLVVATISSCHGAVTLLGPGASPGR